MTQLSLPELLALAPERRVEIYTKNWCGYCRAAKHVLDQLRLPYTEIDVTHDHEGQQVMFDRSEGRRTVPQIFINGHGIGGYTELMTLVQQTMQQQQ